MMRQVIQTIYNQRNGSIATTYSPYVSNPIELCKIGNYKDSIFKAEVGNAKYDSLDSTTKASLTLGNWYIEKNIGKVVLNGTENWANDGGTVGTNYRHNIQVSALGIATPLGTTGNALTDHFKSVTVGNNNQAWGNFYLSSTWLVIHDKDAVYNSKANFVNWLTTNNVTLYYVLATPTYTVINDNYLSTQLNNLQDIILQPNLCYIDWFNSEKPTMTLKYNCLTTFDYDLGVQDFDLKNNVTYTIDSNGLDLKLLNESNTIYTGSGTYTPTENKSIDDVKLVLERGKNYENLIVYPSVARQSSLVTTDFDYHFVDNSGLYSNSYKCNELKTKNGIIASYYYSFTQDSRFRRYIDGNIFNYSELNGKRITAIGFSTNWIGGGHYTTNREVLAVLDTSNYTLTINKDIPMTVARVDEITSDAQFFGLDFPVHLSPKGLESIKKYVEFEDGYSFYRQGLAKLVGVYATNYPTTEGSLVADDFTRDGAIINIESINLISTASGVLPKESMTPTAKRYLQSGGNKYLLYKYKIYQPIVTTDTGGVTTTFEDTGKYYYMAQKIPHFGNIDLKIKYERS